METHWQAHYWDSSSELTVSISELGRKKAHVQEGMSVLGNLEVEYVIYAHVWTHSHSHTCRRQSMMLGVFLYFLYNLEWDRIYHWKGSSSFWLDWLGGQQALRIGLLCQLLYCGYRNMQPCLAIYTNARYSNWGPHTCIARIRTPDLSPNPNFDFF